MRVGARVGRGSNGQGYSTSVTVLTGECCEVGAELSCLCVGVWRRVSGVKEGRGVGLWCWEDNYECRSPRRLQRTGVIHFCHCTHR